MPRDGFVHLHNHSEYSMLDGAARLGDLLAESEAQNMPAVAVTDHGNVFGAYEFWKKAQGSPVKAILGIEAYVTPGTNRADRSRVRWGSGGGDDVSNGGAYTHMTLLAEDNTGMSNLFRLSSLASLDGYFYHPRMDRELLQTHGKGLIATTGCPSGEVQTRLRLGQYDQAVAAAADFRDIFGPENYFVELMDHGLDIETRVRADLLRLSKDLGLPLVATNDLHYVRKEDAAAHEALLCVQSGATMDDPKRFKFDGDSYYLKSPVEMRTLWAELPEACDNTLDIAERCNVTFVEQPGRYMPRFECPPGETEVSWFSKEVQRGLAARYPAGIPERVRERAAFETQIIASKGYCFPPGTPILMGDGTYQPIEQITTDDLVTSFNETTYDTTKGAIEKVLVRAVVEDLVVIQPYGQPLPIEATDEHPFMEQNRGWVQAKDLRVGDSLLLPQAPRQAYEPFNLLASAERKGYTTRLLADGTFVRVGQSERRAARAMKGAMPTKVEWSTDLMWLLGLWVAEGHLYAPDSPVNPGQVCWMLHKGEQAVQQLVDVLDRLGLGRARIYPKTSKAEPDHQGVVVVVTNHPLALLLAELIGSGVRGKRIQPWITSVPEEGLRAFVQGWHQGDRHAREGGRIGVSTVSVDLATQLRATVLSLGSWATLTSQTNARGRETYKVTWHPSPTKSPYGARLVDGQWWVRIREISHRRYEGPVYNLTVAGHHTYVAGNFAVHNCGYFLVVADFIGWARRNGIRVGPGRGSGAGSMAAYAMRITDLDPIVHGLLFERFLNPDRPSMPDFDVDFDERRRGKVITYVTEKYGADHVAQIVTYGTIKAKQAVKDSARVLGHPFAVGNAITKMMPAPVMGKDVPLSKIFDPSHGRYSDGAEFRDYVEANAEAAATVEMAAGLEGLKRQWGVHAAGVIMSSDPLLNIIPIMKREADGAIITQFDFPTCEELGLVKMDFLGLRNLTILEDALANIRGNDKEAPVLEDLPLDDQATFDLMQSGDTLGVFQLDGGPIRALLRSMKPTAFGDISAVLALYRPGPMAANAHNEYADRKNGRKSVTPIHPELAGPLDEILGETYGLIVYQEQVMEIAQRLAGYTLGTADILRRAMGKKKKEVLDKEYLTFEAGMVANGYSAAAVKALWDVLLPFSDYAFNRSHTAAYGLLAYWTGYLKAHYPTEYMAALLTSVDDDADKMALYLSECRRMGISPLSPDVNESFGAFTAVGADIRFGLTAIRNVGAGLVDLLIECRERDGKFYDFSDFVTKCPPRVLNKRAVESMVKAGAFDSLGHCRATLMTVYEGMIDMASSDKKADAVGQDSLFGVEELPAVTVPTTVKEWDRGTLLAFEREMLGLYVSDHPLHGLEALLEKKSTVQVVAFAEEDAFEDGDEVTLAGLLTSVEAKRTKAKQEVWALCVLEDLTSSVECLVFPRVFQTLEAGALNRDVVVQVKGKVNNRDGVVKVFVDSVKPLGKKSDAGPGGLGREERRVAGAGADADRYPAGDADAGLGERLGLAAADDLDGDVGVGAVVGVEGEPEGCGEVAEDEPGAAGAAGAGADGVAEGLVVDGVGGEGEPGRPVALN